MAGMSACLDCRFLARYPHASQIVWCAKIGRDIPPDLESCIAERLQGFARANPNIETEALLDILGGEAWG